MQNWAKRGFQTALVTGGLLMLGTGIASANENVDPDAPVSPIDGGVIVPIDISNNALGTPLGQTDAPELQETVNTHDVTDPVVEGVAAALPEDLLRGNRVNADVVVPLQVTNNAIAALGDAEVSGGDAAQSYDNSQDVHTSGEGEILGGNVIDLDWAAPIQLANNALAAPGGTAKTSGNNAEQDTTTGGDAHTDGSDSVLSGNVLAGHWATPVQFNNNAAAWGGAAESEDNVASSDAHSGGSIFTEGQDGAGSGNVGAVPLAVPVSLNNNAASWIGIADSHGADNSVDATAGDTEPGMNDIPTYVQTKGNSGFVSGNIVQPQGAANATGHGIAGTWIGTSSTGEGDANTHETGSTAGGFSSTSADGSETSPEQGGFGSGNLVDAPIAAPVEAFCIAGSWIGMADANCESTTDNQAGGGTFTTGSGSTAGGNSVHAPIAATPEVFGVGGTWIGTADATATEDKTVTAGGYNGTQGDDSTLGGNLVQTPAAVPVEAFGIGGAWGGSGSGTASETKTVSSGGDNSTVDDNGNGSSNIVAVPVSAPVQLFGIGGAWIGEGHGEATSDTESSAGGYSKASGPGGFLSGNIAQGALATPVQGFGVGGVWGGTASGTAENSNSTTAGDYTETDGSGGTGTGNVVAAAGALPVQVFGVGGSWIGNADGAGVNTTEAAAGGDNTTDGTAGAFSGNVAQAPIAGAATVFGNAGSWVGQATGVGTNDVIASAGGDTTTAGDEGSVSGNVVSPQALPIAQVFGNAASFTAIAGAEGANTTDATSGGDISTSGEEGSLSGNIFDLPVAAVPQVFGNAATLGGVANAVGVNNTTGTVGGLDTTSGDNAALSGIVGQLPLGAVVQVFGVSIPALGEALGVATNVTNISVANDVAQIDLPIDGAEMAIDGLPTSAPTAASLPSVDSFAMPMASPARSGAPQLSPALQPKPISTPAGLPSLPAAPADLPAGPADLPGLGDLPTGLDALPGLPEESVALPMPAPALPVAPALPAAPGVDSLPARSSVPAVPELTADSVMPQVQPGHLQAGQAGFRGVFAKFFGLMTGKPFSIQG